MAKKDEEAVANPPKGGDQTQASTNDDNINDVLNSPFVVTISDGERADVFARFSDRGAADNAAAAAKAKRPQKRIEVKVVKENDIRNGLPALVAEVEAARAE